MTTLPPSSFNFLSLSRTFLPLTFLLSLLSLTHHLPIMFSSPFFLSRTISFRTLTPSHVWSPLSSHPIDFFPSSYVLLPSYDLSLSLVLLPLMFFLSFSSLSRTFLVLCLLSHFKVQKINGSVYKESSDDP